MHPDAHSDERRITYFAATHTRGKREMFGIRAADRGKHVYVIGKTGMGKSTMLENMAIQDIQNGEGIAFIDPHGSTAEKLLDFVPEERIKDVVYFAPFDTDNPIGFNVMEDVGYDKRHLVVAGLMGAFKRIWEDAWSARMEYILQNTLLALLEYPGSTLLDVNRMLTNKTFRAAVIEKITDPIVRSFWTEEFANFTDTYTREATPAIQNKVGQFTANPLIRNIIGQSQSSFDLRKVMDEKKIFIVNLSKGRMGEGNASLLGSMLVVKIYLAAMSRADEPASVLNRLPRFYFYVDEFQSMMNQAFADILSESRKYKLALTLANQYIEQMEEEVRDAVFGNVGTLICFRVGPFDAEVLETIFDPTFTPEDLVGLGIGQIYLTLMIHGVGSRPFSAETIPPIEKPHITYRDDVIRSSRELYGRVRAEIEGVFAKRQQEFALPPKKEKAPHERRDAGSYRPQTQGSGARSPLDMLRQEQALAAAPLSARRPPIPHAPADIGMNEEHNALRAAITAARSAPMRASAPSREVGYQSAPAITPARSPADVLRERLARRTTTEDRARKPAPQPQSQRPPIAHPPPERERPAPQAVSPRREPTQPAASHDAPATAPRIRSNEVTREDLERLLRERD